jgi:HEPN domain-containing protein
MRDSAAEAQRWLRQAENDLTFGELALREGFFAQACFVAQQTAEKALESLAYRGGERLVIGHSIVELVSRLAPAVPDLAELREQAGLLDQYYVATRYPNSLPGGVPFEAFGERQAQGDRSRAGIREGGQARGKWIRRGGRAGMTGSDVRVW